MPETYIPLFTSTVRSSLWSLSGDCLKVFLTLALEAGPDGVVQASIDGIRRLTDLPIQDVIAHLKTLEGPDEHSKDLQRSPSNGGRRIERIAGGWRVINLEWYREEARKQSILFSKRKWWAEKGSAARRDARHIETETETETETSHPTGVRDRARKPRTDSITGGGVARTYSLPETAPPQDYLEEAAMRAIPREQAISTWEHYRGAGLPERGVERLIDWLCKRAKERQNATARVGRKGDSVQPSLGKTGWEILGGKKL